MCTRLRGRVNTRDGALLVGVVVPRFIDGIFERGRRFAVTRGACRQRSRRGKGEDDNGGETGREAGCLLGNNSSSVTRSSSQT